MAGLCEDGNEPPGSLKVSKGRHSKFEERTQYFISNFEESEGGPLHANRIRRNQKFLVIMQERHMSPVINGNCPLSGISVVTSDVTKDSSRMRRDIVKWIRMDLLRWNQHVAIESLPSPKEELFLSVSEGFNSVLQKLGFGGRNSNCTKDKKLQKPERAKCPCCAAPVCHVTPRCGGLRVALQSNSFQPARYKCVMGLKICVLLFGALEGGGGSQTEAGRPSRQPKTRDHRGLQLTRRPGDPRQSSPPEFQPALLRRHRRAV
ncbi:hypothetical protein ANN_05875 [Periplaneta americana]|uniref:Uncharacterized protein n=1 Tax=Periplaneta americana TaxID=6978 RepID=A0ABQ8TC00_PERAM|nr:hypothetical protein ANN_05875 [Periplaneta americana]